VESFGTKEQGTTIVNLSASLIALLGGFSSDFVVRFLNRLLAMVQTLIEGDAKEIVDSKLEEVSQSTKQTV